MEILRYPSWELSYPIKNHFCRWFSFSPGGIGYSSSLEGMILKISFTNLELPSLLHHHPLQIRSLKLSFPFGARPIFRSKLLALGSIAKTSANWNDVFLLFKARTSLVHRGNPSTSPGWRVAIGTYPVGCWRYFWEAIQVSIVRYTPEV